MNTEEEDGGASPATTWPGYVLGLYALVCGLGAVLTARFYPAGWAVLSRPALGCVGATAGLLLLLRDGWWKPLLNFWLLAQSVVLILDPSGSLTSQPGLLVEIVRNGAKTSSGPMLLDYSGYGVNLAPLILLVVVWTVQAKRWYPTGAGPAMDRLAGFLELIFFVAVVAGGVYAGLRWAKPLLNKDALVVIDSPPPGASVYMKDKLLGTTPLAVTQENLVEWGLSKPGSVKKCVVSPSPLGNGLLLQGASATGELLFKPPAWLDAHYVMMPTPWGLRAMSPVHNFTSNYWPVPLISKEQPGLVMDQPVIQPSDCKTGEPFKIAVQMWRNAADPRVLPQPPQPPVSGARLFILFWRQNNLSGASYFTTNFEMPPAWTNVPVGQTVSDIVTLPAPPAPGEYTIRLTCSMMGATNRPLGGNFDPPASFGLLNVK